MTVQAKPVPASIMSGLNDRGSMARVGSPKESQAVPETPDLASPAPASPVAQDAAGAGLGTQSRKAAKQAQQPAAASGSQSISSKRVQPAQAPPDAAVGTGSLRMKPGPRLAPTRSSSRERLQAPPASSVETRSAAPPHFASNKVAPLSTIVSAVSPTNHSVELGFTQPTKPE
jgi:hypothetical protein